MLVPGHAIVPMRLSGEVLRASLGSPQLASAALTSACPGTDENQMARIDWHVLWTKWQRYGESQYGSKWGIPWGIPWDVYKTHHFYNLTNWICKWKIWDDSLWDFGVPQFHIWQYLKENGNTAIIWDPYGSVMLVQKFGNLETSLGKVWETIWIPLDIAMTLPSRSSSWSWLAPLPADWQWWDPHSHNPPDSCHTI